MAIDMRAAVKITAGVTGQQAVDQLRTSMDRVGNTASGLTNKFNMVKGAVGALAAALAVSEFVSFSKSLIDACRQSCKRYRHAPASASRNYQSCNRWQTCQAPAWNL